MRMHLMRLWITVGALLIPRPTDAAGPPAPPLVAGPLMLYGSVKGHLASFSPTGSMILTDIFDPNDESGGLCVWETSSLCLRHKVLVRGSKIATAVFAQDSNSLLVCKEKTLVRLDLATLAQKNIATSPHHFVHVGFSQDRSLAVTALYFLGVTIWDLAREKRHSHIGGKAEYVHSALFTPDGKHLITAHRDGLVRQWDIASGKQIRELFVNKGNITALAVSPCQNWIAIGEYSHRKENVSVWDLATGRRVALMPMKATPACLAFSPCGRALAIGLDTSPGPWATTGTILLQNVYNSRVLARIEEREIGIRSLCFSSDGRLLACSGRLDTTKIYTTPNCLHMWPRWAANVKKPDFPREDRAATLRLERLWPKLANEDATVAFQAMQEIVREKDSAVYFLSRHLAPAGPISSEQIIQLVNDMDSDKLADRDRAEELLLAAGERARTVLERTAKTGSAEVRRRSHRLLEALGPPLRNIGHLRDARGVECLAQIGTPAARLLLQWIASGDNFLRSTQLARASLAAKQ